MVSGVGGSALCQGGKGLGVGRTGHFRTIASLTAAPSPSCLGARWPDDGKHALACLRVPVPKERNVTADLPLRWRWTDLQEGFIHGSILRLGLTLFSLVNACKTTPKTHTNNTTKAMKTQHLEIRHRHSCVFERLTRSRKFATTFAKVTIFDTVFEFD